MSQFVCVKCEETRKENESEDEPAYYDRWRAYCPVCHAFNTLTQASDDGKPLDVGIANTSWVENDEIAVLLGTIPKEERPRISTNTVEFDRCLGGGLVHGSTVLIGGAPGAGKSTLVLQVLMDLTSAETDARDERGRPEKVRALYASAEERKVQIQDRSERLGNEYGELYLLNNNNVYEIEKEVDRLKPDVLAIDSIQMMWKPDVEGGAGSITQIRECAAFIVAMCRKRKIGCFLVCQVVKDDELSGPKALEHLVDAVLTFEKEGEKGLRLLRTKKNRFGPAPEMGLFKMAEKGLISVQNPSELLLEEHVEGKPGISIAMTVVGESGRPIAVEIQALARKPRYRDTERGEVAIAGKMFINGLSKDRANQLTAILDEQCDVSAAGDLYVSVAGGVDMGKDSGTDLGVALAIASAIEKYALPESTCILGEVGLAGEIRLVSFIDERIRAAKLLGFTTIIGPVLRKEDDDQKEDDDDPYIGVASLDDLFEALEWNRVKKETKKSKRPKRGKKGGKRTS